MTSEEVSALRHTPAAISFKLPTDISFDDEEQPITVNVTHDDKTIDTFDVEPSNQTDKPTVEKIFEEIDLEDSGNYVITVDVGRQQYIHKLSVSVGKSSSLF